LPAYAERIPVSLVLGPPEPCPRLEVGVERPETLAPYAAGRGVPRLTRSLIAVHISCLSEGGRPRSGTA
jgi:hypothetical protein